MMRESKSGRTGLPQFLSISIACIGGLILALCVLLVVLQKNAEQKQRENAIEISTDIVESMQMTLRGDQEFLQLLAQERANGLMTDRSLQTRLTQFLADHAEFINISWVDSNFMIRSVAPLKGNQLIVGLHIGLSEPSRASHRAKATRSCAYTTSFAAIQSSSSSFELWVPVYRNDTFLGLFAGVYSCEKLLDHALPHNGLKNFSVCMTDSGRGVLASFPKGSLHLDAPATHVRIDPPGYGAEINVIMLGTDAFGWNVIVLVLVCGVLLVGLVVQLLKLKKETRMREDTERALRNESDRLNRIIIERDLKDAMIHASEQRYTQLFENSLHAIFWGIPDGTILSANPAACRVLECSEEEIKRLGREGIVDQTDPRMKSLHEALVRSGKAFGVIRFLKPHGGAPIEMEISTSVYKDKEGNARATIIAQDITESQEAAKKLQEAQERLKFALEATNDGIWDVWLKTGELYLSPRNCEMLGYDPNELRKDIHEWNSFVHPDDMPETNDRLAAHLDGREPVFRVEQRLKMKSGGWKWVETRGKVVLWDELGHPERMTGTHTDITQRKQLEQQLLQAQKMESIGTLASGIAHEFNNILGVIMGQASMLMNPGHDEQRVAKGAKSILKVTEHGAALVAKLLTFARRTEIMLVSLDLNDVLRMRVMQLQETLPKTIVMTAGLGSGIPTILADPSEIHQIVMHLVANACDAMPDGGTLRIASSAEAAATVRTKFPDAEAPSYVVMRIEDSGSGIDAAVKQKIFDPFFTTKEVGKGTGLGLALVHTIVKQLKGFVDVETTDPQGTAFAIYLPAEEKSTTAF